MSKRCKFKPGDLVKVLDAVVDRVPKLPDVGLVVPGIMKLPLVKAHSKGVRQTMYRVLISGEKQWINGSNLKILRKSEDG
jgi:hypothetical protein